MEVKDRPQLRVKPEVRAQWAAEADIRRSLNRHSWGPDVAAQRELIEDAALILVAISRMKRCSCIGSEWYVHLSKHIYRIKAWEAFDLLQALGFVYCDDFADPCDEGYVEINPTVLGKYASGNRRYPQDRRESRRN